MKECEKRGDFVFFVFFSVIFETLEKLESSSKKPSLFLVMAS